MALRLKAAALHIGGKIHPLMGPIFTGRPNSTGVGDTCTMCIGNYPGNADSEVIDASGHKSYVCLAHELLLHRAFGVRKTGGDGVSEYAGYALGHIMDGVHRPRWMPARLYARLESRAAYWARLLALTTIVDKARPIAEAQAARMEAAAAELDRNTRKLTD
ncbi:hypothetical protein [Paeniglutamicibacter antarcticus]|uniref:Uncharacterized protein n=1 Tax=Paeniglutamicibacter antarcticus TaxID=494023 RepID=A0ABP9TNC7_9MICC